METKHIRLNAEGDMTRIIATQNGPDDQDYEEVLLSDSEKFTPFDIVGMQMDVINKSIRDETPY